MANVMPERPARIDPSTALPRPGQQTDPSPANPYQAPRNGVSAPTPRLVSSSAATDMGRPGGPGFGPGTSPRGIPSEYPPIALGRGGADTSMTGPLMPSGNSPSDYTVRPTASAEDSREQVIGSVLEQVRRNGGRPFDGR